MSSVSMTAASAIPSYAPWPSAAGLPFGVIGSATTGGMSTPLSFLYSPSAPWLSPPLDVPAPDAISPRLPAQMNQRHQPVEQRSNPSQNLPVLATSIKQALSQNQSLLGALGGVGLIAASLYLRKFPVKASRFEFFPTDWKIWAQTIMGSMAVTKLNQAINASPPPWLNALETVAVVSPLVSGPLRSKTWRQLPLLAVGVPLLVQATQLADQKLEALLSDRNSSVPKWIPRMALSVVSVLVGLFGLRGVMKMPAYQQFVQGSPSSVASATVGAEATIVCARCGGVHLICVNEIADVTAGLLNWLKQGFQANQQSNQAP
ncbi:MAG: hypothetical protein VKK59_05740 [Vampirovibrionales bacterium]|nr:hypothetical protein [Vampirovibrionales bacterium]